MGTEPGSINLQIQQDPNASSLGARSQIGFGQNVAQLGQQVFTLGAKLQEIKNNTELTMNTQKLQQKLIHSFHILLRVLMLMHGP